MQTIALIAHDKKKDEMLEFVGHHKDLLKIFIWWQHGPRER